MAELLTFADAKNDRMLKTVSGVCTDSDAFRQFLNAAIRQLMRRGDWFGLLHTIRLCGWDNCFALPKFVGAIRGVNVCNQPIAVANNWWQFLRYGSGTLKPNCWSSQAVLQVNGLMPTYRNVPCGNTNCYIRAYVRFQADIGKTITFYGLDTNGQVVMTKQSDGTWVEGQTLKLATPFVSTNTTFRTITRVRKDVTQGPLDIFLYDSTTNVLLECAHYGPKEQNPGYIASTLGGIVNQCCSPCTSMRQLDVLFKMAEVPVEDDTDILGIQNMDALAAMINSQKKREAGDLAGSNEEAAIAVHEMNLAERDAGREDTLPVEVAIYGSAHLWHKRIGSNI